MAAVFAIGFGMHVWMLTFSSQPLAWAGLDNDDALVLGQAMSLAGVIHALGIRINGNWRWSPALRFLGMCVHAGAFLYLSWSGAGQTAGYTYLWGAGLAWAGAWSAARDLKRAYTGEEAWMVI